MEEHQRHHTMVAEAENRTKLPVATAIPDLRPVGLTPDDARFVETDVGCRSYSSPGTRCAPRPHRTSAFQREFHAAMSDASRASPSGAVATRISDPLATGLVRPSSGAPGMSITVTSRGVSVTRLGSLITTAASGSQK